MKKQEILDIIMTLSSVEPIVTDRGYIHEKIIRAIELLTHELFKIGITEVDDVEVLRNGLKLAIEAHENGGLNTEVVNFIKLLCPIEKGKSNE